MYQMPYNEWSASCERQGLTAQAFASSFKSTETLKDDYEEWSLWAPWVNTVFACLIGLFALCLISTRRNGVKKPRKWRSLLALGILALFMSPAIYHFYVADGSYDDK